MENILLVGLGGGLLPTFLHCAIQSVSYTVLVLSPLYNMLCVQARLCVVELDPMMKEVASKWFGFTVDDRMAVHIGDGLEFVHQQTAGMKTPGDIYNV